MTNKIPCAAGLWKGTKHKTLLEALKAIRVLVAEGRQNIHLVALKKGYQAGYVI